MVGYQPVIELLAEPAPPPKRQSVTNQRQMRLINAIERQWTILPLILQEKRGQYIPFTQYAM